MAARRDAADHHRRQAQRRRQQRVRLLTSPDASAQVGAERVVDPGADLGVRVSADLRFAVDAPGGGRAAGTVNADGSTVIVRTDQPATLIRSLGSADRRRTATAGALLSAAGVTLEVVGPRGVLGRFGAGIDSRLGHLLTGSPAVDVRGAAVATWRPQPRVVGIAAAGVALVAVAVAGLRTRRG